MIDGCWGRIWGGEAGEEKSFLVEVRGTSKVPTHIRMHPLYYDHHHHNCYYHYYHHDYDDGCVTTDLCDAGSGR